MGTVPGPHASAPRTRSSQGNHPTNAMKDTTALIRIEATDENPNSINAAADSRKAIAPVIMLFITPPPEQQLMTLVHIQTKARSRPRLDCKIAPVTLLVPAGLPNLAITANCISDPSVIGDSDALKQA